MNNLMKSKSDNLNDLRKQAVDLYEMKIAEHLTEMKDIETRLEKSLKKISPKVISRCGVFGIVSYAALLFAFPDIPVLSNQGVMTISLFTGLGVALIFDLKETSGSLANKLEEKRKVIGVECGKNTIRQLASSMEGDDDFKWLVQNIIKDLKLNTLNPLAFETLMEIKGQLGECKVKEMFSNEKPDISVFHENKTLKKST